MKSILAAAALCVLFASSALAQTAPKADGDARHAPPIGASEPMAAPIITADTVVYKRADHLHYAGDYYPQRAQDDAVEGKVVLACEVGDAGQVVQCIVVSETPGNYEFARSAAHSVLKYAHVDPSKNAVGSWLRLTMNFSLR